MDSLGTWNLTPHGYHLLTTNQSESLNAALKRRIGPERHKQDELVLKLFGIDQTYELKIGQSRYGFGEYNILEILKPSYQLSQGTKIPKPIKAEEIVEKLKAKHLSLVYWFNCCYYRI